MTETVLTEASMLSSLHDLRLPSYAAGGIAAELAVAVGLAGLLALVVVAGLRLISRRTPKPATMSLQDRLTDLANAPEETRRVALLHLLREKAPDRFQALKGQLYRPGSTLDLTALEAEVRRHV